MWLLSPYRHADSSTTAPYAAVLSIDKKKAKRYLTKFVNLSLLGMEEKGRALRCVEVFRWKPLELQLAKIVKVLGLDQMTLNINQRRKSTTLNDKDRGKINAKKLYSQYADFANTDLLGQLLL